MRIIAELQMDARWDALWDDLARLGELGPREAELVADTGRRGIHRNFERESAPDGAPWHPLARQTQLERAGGIDHRGVPFRVAPEHPILQRTRDLLLSFTDPRHPRNVTQVERGNGSTFLTLGAEDDPRTPDRIAKLHAGGQTETGRVIPPRPFVGLGAEAQRQVETQARAVLRQRVERLGG